MAHVSLIILGTLYSLWVTTLKALESLSNYRRASIIWLHNTSRYNSCIPSSQVILNAKYSYLHEYTMLFLSHKSKGNPLNFLPNISELIKILVISKSLCLIVKIWTIPTVLLLQFQILNYCHCNLETV